MYSMNLSDQLKGEIDKFLNTLMPKECVEMTQTYDSSIFPSKLINVMFLPHNMIFIPAASTIGDRIFFYHFGLSRSEFENPTFRSQHLRSDIELHVHGYWIVPLNKVFFFISNGDQKPLD